ncbi:Bifunctional protein HldE [Phycisphaerae bacterium RAS1]|nr:Bifunctional protein HldE [Phycisphaerae bacterium RAS1]
MNHDLLPIVDKFPGRRVLLVGDFMLDRYVIGDAERISPEAPVPVLLAAEDEERVGGAGSVALNVVALGGQVLCFGLIGRDGFGDRVERLLKDSGAEIAGLLRVDDRPTITKTRIVGLAEHRHRQQILRVDRELVKPPAPGDLDKLVEAIERALPNVDVVCLEDYAKGLLSEELCRRVIGAAAAQGKPVLVDPARSPNWQRYAGSTLLTPNRAELEIGVGRTLRDDALVAAATEIVERLRLACIVVTLGRDGALLVRRDGSQQRFPTVPRAVYDNTGAGDAVLAMMAVAMAAGAPVEQAVPLANIAGGLEVSKFGCVPITRAEVLHELHHGPHGRKKLRSLAELAPELAARRQRGETVVFTNGCFDILHPGHVELLEKAKQLGSLLVVGVNSDASMKQQGKGDDRPIRDQAARCRMLAALEAVDFLVLFDDESVENVVKAIGPDVIAKGSEVARDGRGVVGGEWVQARGGRVVLIEHVEGWSTTRELQRIRGS